MEEIKIEIYDKDDNRWLSSDEVVEVLDFWRPDWR
jgi:hypothetical protein